jgi:hypothetical protein
MSALLAFAATSALPTRAEWRVVTAGEDRQSRPPRPAGNASTIQPGDRWPTDNKFRWLLGELELPEKVGQVSTAGKTLGLQISCGDGGEVWVGDQLQTRFDNDHPALVIVTNEAQPGARARVAVQVYGKVQGGDKFDQANWVIIEPRRAQERLRLTVDPTRDLGPVPDGIVGLSQGGGMSDYEDATAKKLREGGFKWFRMDNVFTSILKKNKETGGMITNWTELDQRVDFMHRIGADPILAVSYMPQVLDAVPNPDRQSAPRDYAVWEELCYQAATRCLERNRRVAFWEVWNEVNTGWLKPGPDDTGSAEFQKLYERALGHEQTNTGVIRRFEAYCKLYRATARGLRRADPLAKIGGPALASGPMERSKDCGHCAHGQGFARGLMLWCEQEKLPLDFVSWHEYFQSPSTLVREAQTFRSYLDEFPALQKTVGSFMITEWNEAWWPDRPQDHEVGAAWCANSITRAFLPARIDRPCFFYVKQGDRGFRGDYSLLMKDNVPKAAYNVAKIFNGLSGQWIALTGTDDDISGVAAWDAARSRLAVVLVNFRDRYALRRQVRVELNEIPAALRGGEWREWTVDATHSNVWHDANRAELTRTASGSLDAPGLALERTLGPNSVTLIELIRN